MQRSYAFNGALMLVIAAGCGEPSGEAALPGETSGDDTLGDTEGGETSASAGETATDAEAESPWDQGWPIPASEQVPGDADSGYWAMLNEGYVTCGIPFSIFGLVSGALGSFASGDPLPGRAGPNAEVPYNWTVHVNDDGAEIRRSTVSSATRASSTASSSSAWVERTRTTPRALAAHLLTCRSRRSTSPGSISSPR